LLWPGAPGCTMDTPSDEGFACWHRAAVEARESNPTLKRKALNDMTSLTSNAPL
jgi:hypothetical protein